MIDVLCGHLDDLKEFDYESQVIPDEVEGW